MNASNFSIASLTVAELKEKLSALGKPLGGLKKDLVMRLKHAISTTKNSELDFMWTLLRKPSEVLPRKKKASNVTRRSPPSPMPSVNLAAINDFEVFASAMFPRVLETSLPPQYTQVNIKGNRYLKWGDPSVAKGIIEIQQLADNAFWRVGAIGDGNCLLHSMFTAASPTYRRLTYKQKMTLVDKFRKVLVLRMDTLKEIFDLINGPALPAAEIPEIFENLKAYRSEIDIMLAPTIVRLYGYNFLAVRITDDKKMEPVCQTLLGRDSSLSTIFIHHAGGSSGHYEVIIQPVFEKDNQLDEISTKYVMTDRDLSNILLQFILECGEVANTKLNMNSIVAITSKRLSGNSSNSHSTRRSSSSVSSSSPRSFTRKARGGPGGP